MKNRYFAFILLLSFSLLGCAQNNPPANDNPEIKVDQSKVEVEFPPLPRDNIDRSNWTERPYGTPPLYLKFPFNMPNTGDRMSDANREYIEENNTWAAGLESDLQFILNYVRYKPGLNMRVEPISDFAVQQLAADHNTSDIPSRTSPITVSGADQGLRADGMLFIDGERHFWALATLKVGQEIWQLTAIYPEDYIPGPGDVEAILASVRLD